VCRAAWLRREASIVEDRQVEPDKVFGVGEYVDLDDLPAPDREAHDREWLTAPEYDPTDGSIYKRRLGEKLRAAKAGEGERLVGHGRRATDLSRRGGERVTVVCSEHDSGSSTASSAPKSPPRAAARKASTTYRWRPRSASGAGAAPRTRRRAWLASFLAAVGDRPTTGLPFSRRTDVHALLRMHRTQVPSPAQYPSEQKGCYRHGGLSHPPLFTGVRGETV
jgi:hypothetical protein